MPIGWTKNQTPLDLDAGDKFYSEEGGLQEAQYVFIEQNNLRQRFALSPSFCIGELGFGTGLNFLATLKAWNESPKPEGALLHYVSFDRSLWQPEDIQRALQVWPELSPTLKEFLEVYEPFARGTYRYFLNNRKVRLSLHVGDIRETLPQFGERKGIVDAWFLDGFAPSKNPEMWSPQIFCLIRHTSKPNATFATFTSAGDVRRGLESEGFCVQRLKGFGRKREMLKGALQESAAEIPSLNPIGSPPSVTIIGGGIAGAAMAWALKERGAQVRILEKGPTLFGEASGAEMGIVSPVLTSYPSLATHLSLTSFQMFRSLKAPEFVASGLLQIQQSEKNILRAERGLDWIGARSEFCRLVFADEASSLAGVEVSSPALYFSRAGFLKLKNFAESFVRNLDPDQIHLNSDVLSIERSAESGNWICRTFEGRSYESSYVVVACSLGAQALQGLGWLPLVPMRGQSLKTNSTQPSQALKTVVFGEKSVTPSHEGHHHLGATFDREDLTTNLKEEDDREIFESIDKILPQLKLSQESRVSSWAGLRVFSAEKLPLIGEAVSSSGETLQNCYLSIAHGSKGVLNAPLAAELICAQIFDEPLPVNSQLLEALDPATHWQSLKVRGQL